MKVVASTIYLLVQFPHQGKFISFDQLDYCMSDLWFDSATNVPLVSNFYQVPKLIGAGLFEDPCLMGVFPPSVPNIVVSLINMISFVGTHLGDPWVILNPSEVESYYDTMPLLSAKLSYSTIQCKTESNVFFSQQDELD